MKNAGLYLHIPFCSSKCPYCDFVSFKADLDTQKNYVSALKKQVDYLADSGVANDLVFDTVFVGGGTPSVLFSGGLSEIFSHIASRFRLNISEFSVECNPESTTKAFIDECVSVGTNRLSFGLQTTQNHLLKGLRQHSFEDFLRALDHAKGAKIDNINADLMLNLPNQTLQNIEDSAQTLADLGLKHISAYALSVEKNTPLFRSGYRTDDDKSEQFYQKVVEILSQNGFNRYEVSNFCQSGYECKHNLKYWTMQPYLGLGLASSSYFGNTRTTTTADFGKFLAGDYCDFSEDVSDKFAYEYVMLALRTSQGIDLKTLNERGIDLLKNAKVQEFLNKKILISTDHHLTLAPTHFYLLNAIITQILD